MVFLQLTPVNAAIFQLNAIDAAFFTVKGRWRCCFFGKTQLTPLFFQLRAVNTAIFPDQRC